MSIGKLRKVKNALFLEPGGSGKNWKRMKMWSKYIVWKFCSVKNNYGLTEKSKPFCTWKKKHEQNLLSVKKSDIKHTHKLH